MLLFHLSINGQVEVDPVTGFPIAEDEGPEIAPKDSTVQKTKYSFRKSFGEYYPHPRTALYLGFGFPAGGQIYNKDYWKVPIFWGGYGFLVYLVNDNTQLYRSLRGAVRMRLAGEPDPFINSIPNISQLRQRRDAVRKTMEQSYIAFLITHLLIAGESFVSAHLKSFDVSEDISLKIGTEPINITGSYNSINYAIGLKINYQISR